MSETEINRLGTSLINLIDKLSTKIDTTNEEMKGSMRNMFTTEATVQRAAITEQANRVTNLEANLANLLVSIKAIKREKELRAAAAADFQAAKGEYEGIQELFREEAAVQGSVISKQLPTQAEEGPDLELPEYEDIPDMSPEEMLSVYLNRIEIRAEEDF